MFYTNKCANIKFMKTQNSVLMEQARESLSGKWGLAAGTYLVYFLIITIAQYVPKVGGLIYLIVGGPLSLGLAIFILSLSRKQNPRLEDIFEGFKSFGTSLVAYLLMIIFIALWLLLLIVPGLIAFLSYSMTFFIIAEDKNIGARDAIKKSKEMMRGYKWKLFCMHCRFIGWALLSILTLGIGWLWLAPYMQVSLAKFYEDLKQGSVEAIA